MMQDLKKDLVEKQLETDGTPGEGMNSIAMSERNFKNMKDQGSQAGRS